MSRPSTLAELRAQSATKNVSDTSLLKSLFALLRRVGISPAYLAIPIFISFLAASLEGIGMGLLIPLLQGFLEKDFSFLKDITGVRHVLALLPESILHSDKSLFVFLLSLFCIVILLKNVLRYMSSVSIAYFVQRAGHQLRKLLFGRYLRFGKLYFDKTSVGHHSAVFSEFLGTALKPLLNIDSLVSSLFSLLIYTGIMLTISWKLTLVAMPLFIVLHIGLRFLTARMQGIARSIARSASNLSRKTIDILSAIPLVQAYNTEEKERRHYASISGEKVRLDTRMTMVDHLMRPLQELTTLVAMLALFTTMTWLLVRDHATAAPQFLVYFYLVYNAATKFGALSGFRGILAVASGALAEVLLIFDDADKHIVPDGSTSFTGLQKGIDLRCLSFSYTADREVLHDLSFTIERGKMTAIIGPTGTGKTTIVHLLLRFYDCAPGTIFIDDTDVRQFTAGSLRAHMALVSQDTLLLHDTLKHNITYGAEKSVTDDDVQDALRRARLTDFVASLPQGLETLIGDRGVKLSGGEKQRVSIARALLRNPEILLLDEATSALDAKTESLIQEAIDDAAEGRTVVVIAHRLSTIRHADRIVVLEEGRCVEQGSLQELLDRKGRFSEYWERQRFS